MTAEGARSKGGAATTYRYFAYGSNMSGERLRQRTPSACAIGIARLPGHGLRWHKLGRDGTGKCDIAPCGMGEKEVVWGVLYDIAVAERALLDRIEGLGVGYSEARVRVATAAGCVLALTYQAKPDKIDPTLRPLPDYKAFVLRGAVEHGLPADYIAALRQVETVRE